MAVAIGLVPTLARAALAALGSSTIRDGAWVQSGAPTLQAAVGRVLMKNYSDSFAGLTSQQANAIARDVVRTQRFADFLTGRSPFDSTAGAVPVDRELLPGDELYRYAFVIARELPDGTHRREIGEYRSDVFLSPAEVEARVRAEDFVPLSPPTASRPGRPALADTQIIDVQIVQIGRRGP